jgi:hypothetical protein
LQLIQRDSGAAYAPGQRGTVELLALLLDRIKRDPECANRPLYRI